MFTLLETVKMSNNQEAGNINAAAPSENSTPRPRPWEASISAPATPFPAMTPELAQGMANLFSAMHGAFLSMPHAAGAAPPPAPHSIPAVRWGNMAQLNVNKRMEVDTWFIAFEEKMRSWRIPEANWAACFSSCERVPQEIKSRIPAAAVTHYRDIRLNLLKLHGPKDPVGFYIAMLHEVRGTTREVVRQQLTNLLELLNRALRDDGLGEWQSHRLVWPFIRAFPPKERRELERHLGAALRAEDRMGAIYEYAPTEGSPDESVLAAALPADPLDSREWESDSKFPDPQKSDAQPAVKPVTIPGLEEALTAALSNVARSNPPRRGPRLNQNSQFSKRPSTTTPSSRPTASSTCRNCGGAACTNPLMCPARGKNCSYCQKLGHFERVCMAKLAGPNPTNRPFRRANPPNRRS